MLRFECNDLDTNNKVDFIGSCEVDLASLVKNCTENSKSFTLGDKCGSLKIQCNETSKTKERIHLDIQAANMPSMNNIWAFQFSSTYFLEIFRGPRGNNVKIYESEWYVNDPNHRFKGLEFSDSQFCNGDPDMKIEFKFINRNQYMMENTEICYLETSLNELCDHAGAGVANNTYRSKYMDCKSPNGEPLGKLRIMKIEKSVIPSFS